MSRAMHYFLKSANRPRQPIIGLAMSRSIEVPIATLAAWGLGAAVLPLNPDWPQNRLAEIYNEVRPDFVVVDRPGLESVFENNVTLEALQSLALEETDGNSLPQEAMKDTDWAYIIYTSGSTGKPKGVIISALSFRSYIAWTRRYFAGSNAIRSLLITSEFTFDIAMGDLAFALAFGCEILVAKENRNIPGIAGLISKNKVEVLYSVPSTHNALMEFVARKGNISLSSLKLVLSGGDSFPWKLVESYKAQAPHALFYNMYGPTEFTINCFAYRLDDKIPPSHEGQPVPIGECFDHLDFCLLDDNGKEAAQGELCIGGPQAMAGYFKDIAMTESRFTNDPRVNATVRPMYRTGDVAEIADGKVFLKGRIDELIKIRGFRIHPSEVATAINSHPDVMSSAVVPLRKGRDSQLVAYVVCHPREAISEPELRAFLSEVVPSYMIPSRIRLINELPLNSSGKLDRKKLVETEAEV